MVNINNLSQEIAEALKTYTNEVTEGLEKAKVEVAKNTVKILKETSPKDTGAYAKSWTVKSVGNAVVVHNKNYYQHTHLLENGHAKRGGGRVAGITHIKPAEEKAIAEYIEKVEKVIRG